MRINGIDKSVRRALLKPLVRRSQGIADRKAILAALGRLDGRALGEDVLQQLREVLSAGRRDKRSGSWKDPAAVEKYVTLARALYASRRISTQEYVFYAASPVEDLQDSRVLDDNELGQVNQAIEAVRKRHGLSEDEYWRLGDGPDEYVRLNEQFDALYKRKLLDALRGFGLNDLADLKERRPEEYDRLRERGRRSVFHRDEHALAIRDIVLRHEQDAKRAAAAQAYSAAVTSLGAGVEGLLLLRCLRSKAKARRVAQSLKKRVRPRFPDDPTTWTFETLIEVCLQAGWLPPVETSLARYNSAGLAHLLRTMRNHVHPGRQAKEKPWCETDERDYEDADAIYVILLSTLARVRQPEDSAVQVIEKDHILNHK